jgi:hypothetical protein
MFGWHCYGVDIFIPKRRGNSLRGLRTEVLFLPIHTVLRLLTSATMLGSDVRKMPEAWQLWDKVCADDRVAYLSEPEE